MVSSKTMSLGQYCQRAGGQPTFVLSSVVATIKYGNSLEAKYQMMNQTRSYRNLRGKLFSPLFHGMRDRAVSRHEKKPVKQRKVLWKHLEDEEKIIDIYIKDRKPAPTNAGPYDDISKVLNMIYKRPIHQRQRLGLYEHLFTKYKFTEPECVLWLLDHAVLFRHDDILCSEIIFKQVLQLYRFRNSPESMPGLYRKFVERQPSSIRPQMERRFRTLTMQHLNDSGSFVEFWKFVGNHGEPADGNVENNFDYQDDTNNDEFNIPVYALKEGSILLNACREEETKYNMDVLKEIYRSFGTESVGNAEEGEMVHDIIAHHLDDYINALSNQENFPDSFCRADVGRQTIKETSEQKVYDYKRTIEISVSEVMSSLYAGAIKALGYTGRLEDAEQMFETMVTLQLKRSIEVHNNMLKVYVFNNESAKALDKYKYMIKHFEVDIDTYNAILPLADAELVKDVLFRINKSARIYPNMDTYMRVINVCVKNGDYLMAAKYYKRMGSKNHYAIEDYYYYNLMQNIEPILAEKMKKVAKHTIPKRLTRNQRKAKGQYERKLRKNEWKKKYSRIKIGTSKKSTNHVIPVHFDRPRY